MPVRKGEIMEERKLNEHKCSECGRIFYTFGKSRRKLCDECVKARERKRSKEMYTNVFGKKTFEKEKPRSIYEIMREIDEYNRQHNTHLSYGQYANLTNK